MGDQEFERYLALLAGMLKLSRRQKESIASELRDHLEERLAELKESGVDDDQAVREALEEFGDIASLANEFAGIQGSLRRRSIMRFTVGMGAVGIAAVFLLIFWPATPMVREAGAQAPAKDAASVSPPPVVAADSEDAEDAEVYLALSKPVTLQAKDEPFQSVVERLVKQLGIPIDYDAAVRDEGLDPERRVTLNLKNVPGETALQLLLEPVSLTYSVQDGGIEALGPSSTPASTTRFYPVADLLEKQQLPPVYDFGQELENPLVLLLTNFIAPYSWDSVGGPASVRVVQGTLAVSQTKAVHRQIVPFLNELRRVSKAAPGREQLPAESPVAKALAKKVKWDFKQTPLAEAAQRMTADLGVPVVVVKRGSEDLAEITATTAIAKGQMTAQRALQLLLPPSSIGWANVHGEVLKLTDVSKTTEVRMYNIRDLLARSEDDEKTPDYQSISGVIETMIRPQSWEQVGGIGRVQGFGDMLVVSHTAEIHDLVAELLTKLRQARELQKVPVVAANPNDLQVRVYSLQLFVIPSAVAKGTSLKSTNGIQSAKDLLALVQQLIEPKSWQSAGGKGQIFHLTDPQGVSLVIKQTPAVHREIRRLLTSIESEVERKMQALEQLYAVPEAMEAEAESEPDAEKPAKDPEAEADPSKKPEA